MAWSKGQSGNTRGRPLRGLAWAEVLREMGNTLDQNGKSNMVAVAQKLWEMAKEGDARAIGLIMERMDGKAFQNGSMDLSSNGEGIVKIERVIINGDDLNL